MKKIQFSSKAKLLMIIQVILLVMLITACSDGNTKESKAGQTADSDGNQSVDFYLLEEGSLTYASEGAFRPFNYMEGNEMVGYDIDVANAIAEKLGLEPNPVKARYDGIVLGVQNKRYDTAVASLTITDERKEHVNFTIPYYETKTRIYTRPDSDITTIDDLENKDIAVSRGSTFKDIALEYTVSSNISEYDGDNVTLQALAEGHHDAVITNNMIGQSAIQEGLEIVEIEEDLMVNQAGIAVAKDNDALLESINDVLVEMVESGELEKISMKWIGVDITVPLED